MNITRRNSIKGLTLTAGGLLAPFVQALEPRERSKPQRFVFIIEGNGLPPNQIQPKGIMRTVDDLDRNSSSNLVDQSIGKSALPEALTPLVPFADRLTILQGLSGRICGGGHSNNFGTLGVYSGRAGAVGQTIDMALAEALPAVIPQVGLGISQRPTDTTIYNCSAQGRDKKRPTFCRPDLAYQHFFGSVATNAGRQNFDANTDLLDFMSREIGQLDQQLDGSEKDKLNHYLSAFESLRDRQSRLQGMEAVLKKHAPAVTDKYRSPIETDRLDAHFDLGAAALISGLTNVLTIASGVGDPFFNIKFSGLDIPITKHSIGHAGNYQGVGWEEMMIKIRTYHMSLIARLAGRLQAIPEGAGTMLDTTTIIYLSDAAENHHSRCWEWPILMLGKTPNKTSRFLNYPKYGNNGHRTIANFYTSLLRSAGAPRDHFGLKDPNLRDLNQDGPLEELELA